MKNVKIICALIVSVFLIACGSGGGSTSDNSVPMDGRVSLSCAEATNLDNGSCSGSPEGQGDRVALAVDGAVDSIFNSGDVRKSQFVYYEMEAANGTDAQARVYMEVDEGGVAGCEDRNLKTGTYPFDVDSGMLMNMGTSGTNYDICATNGASWANVTIYNGSHLALDIMGDSAIDEPLYTTTILWNFTD